MQVTNQDGDASSTTIESRTADNNSVAITLTALSNKIPTDGVWTRVSVRAGTLGFGDEEVSQRILEQISGHLAATGLRPVAAPPTTSQVVPAGGLAPLPQTPPPPLATEPNWQAPRQ